MYWILSSNYLILWAGTAQSVQQLTQGWSIWWSNPSGSEIFCTRPDQNQNPPSLLYNGYWVFPRGNFSQGVVSSADHKERVEIYLPFPFGSSWLVLGWTLPLPLLTSDYVNKPHTHTHTTKHLHCDKFYRCDSYEYIKHNLIFKSGIYCKAQSDYTFTTQYFTIVSVKAQHTQKKKHYDRNNKFHKYTYKEKNIW
jgi:hypothetical protein